MTTALLIIDVQHALCFGEYEAFEAKRVIERINVVSRKMREAGAPVVVIQHEAPDGPLEYGTEGWNLAAGLDVQPTDIYVRKKATDSFHNTDLQAHSASTRSEETRNLRLAERVLRGYDDPTGSRSWLSCHSRLGCPLNHEQQCLIGCADHGAPQRDAGQHHQLWASGRGSAVERGED